MIATALALLLTVGMDQATPALAVPADPNGYIQAALIITVQPPGTANHRVFPPLEGHAIGIAAAAGRFVTPRVAIEGEFVFSGAIAAPQRFSYNWTEDYSAESRDMGVGRYLYQFGASVRVKL